MKDIILIAVPVVIGIAVVWLFLCGMSADDCNYFDEDEK